LVAALAAGLLSACSAGETAVPPAAPTLSSEPTAAATMAATLPPAPPTVTPVPPSPSPAPTATTVPAPVAWFDASVDPALATAIGDLVLSMAGSGAAGTVTKATTTDRAAASLVVAPGVGLPLAAWFYVPVVPFPTIVDDITSADLAAFWAGDNTALSAITGDGTSPTLYTSASTLAALTALWGEPAAAAPITVLPADALLETAWTARPRAWAVVPFDALEPRWKVLRLDGLSLLDKSLDTIEWPLTLEIGVQGTAADDLLQAAIAAQTPLTNRITADMTVLMMTGVTAMVRGTANTMETMGILYPAQDIGPTLASADLTHISNELPFYSNCPPPDPAQESLVFCSSPRYMDLLRAVGTDVVELTGNHFQDYGDEATLETIALYDSEGWPYYGGGANLVDASEAITLTANGNVFSFIGCNPVGPEYAWATEERPGAAPCDWDFMHRELQRLAAEVDVPIATFQYWEHYFYEATAQQSEDFRSMADAGAEIVSGSQAHHPQAIEFYNGAFIHYGLGNLFFDQMQSLGTRQEFVDRHVIYQGRHISTELLTYMLEDYARPRPMTADERRDLLTAVFAASGW